MTRRTDVWSCRCGWTATDCLLLDVEQVEGWCREVVADGDPRTRTLVGIVTRLRACADSLADYLLRASDPVRSATGADADAACPRRAASGAPAKGRHARKQGPGRDSGGRPQGVPSGPERSAPEAPASTIQGLLQRVLRAPSAKGSFHE